MILWVLPLGLGVGLVLGALGGGGAILTVPALVYLLDQDPRAATTASLVIVGLSSLVGMLPHRRAGNVRVREGLVFGALGVVGSVAGSAASQRVDPLVLMVAFAVLMLVVAAIMAWRLGHSPSERTPAGPTAAQPVAPLVATATGIGVLTGFFGVGGGFAVVPALTLVLGFPMRAAVGTSLLVIAVNSATSLAARVALGGPAIDWAVVGPFAAAAVVGSLLGGRVSARANPRHLTAAFIVMLLAIALFMLVRSVPSLG